MIQPQELRIGNYLNEEVLGTCIVSQITEKTIWVLTNNLKEDGTQNKREFHIWIKHLQPIPITEDELIKLGFKGQPADYYKDKLSIVLENSDIFHKKGRVYFNSWAILEEQPKYVHQLQNLYFALTNKELTYKI